MQGEQKSVWNLSTIRCCVCIVTGKITPPSRCALLSENTELHVMADDTQHAHHAMSAPHANGSIVRDKQLTTTSVHSVADTSTSVSKVDDPSSWQHWLGSTLTNVLSHVTGTSADTINTVASQHEDVTFNDLSASLRVQCDTNSTTADVYMLTADLATMCHEDGDTDSFLALISRVPGPSEKDAKEQKAAQARDSKTGNTGELQTLDDSNRLTDDGETGCVIRIHTTAAATGVNVRTGHLLLSNNWRRQLNVVQGDIVHVSTAPRPARVRSITLTPSQPLVSE